MAKSPKSPAALKFERALSDARKQLRQLEDTESALHFESRMVPPVVRIKLDAARKRLADLQMEDAYGHMAGTAETYAKIASIPSNRRQSPIATMFEHGQITESQRQAAIEIEAVATAIESAVAVRGASLEARVDNSGAGRDVLIESLGRVRLEIVYSLWRNQLPMPRRMILDMVLTNRSLVATARVYGMAWRPARKLLLSALDRWEDLKERTWQLIDAEDVEAVYRRLGCGVLLPPRPRMLPTEDEED